MKILHRINDLSYKRCTCRRCI